MKAAFFRILTVIFFLILFTTPSGYEWGMFGTIRMIVQMVVCGYLGAKCHQIAEKTEKRTNKR